jgi:hypothetical protein
MHEDCGAWFRVVVGRLLSLLPQHLCFILFES